MKILYGVQGNGNAHTTRARLMAEALKKHDVIVDYLFSGNDNEYINMEPFGEYRTLQGLSFVTEQGQINYLKTLKRNNISKFFSDIRQLDTSSYDLVITDFEPVTAWAAKFNHIPSIGLSHQNAFRYRVPRSGNNIITTTVLKWFAPADNQPGFHWHHFNAPILPPMIKTDLEMLPVNSGKIMVYQPVLPLDEYHDLFHRFPDYEFVQYHPVDHSGQQGNVCWYPLSREGFIRDFSDCSGIISSAGFDTCSEAVHYGKKLFVTPLQGQMEQQSNAVALEQLGYGKVKKKIKRKSLKNWLDKPQPVAVNYPDVAAAVAQWIVDGCRPNLETFSRQLWAQLDYQPQMKKLSKNNHDIPENIFQRSS